MQWGEWFITKNVCIYASEAALPTDCEAIQKEGRYKRSGIYRVQPVVNVRPFFVYCELSDRGGGWTVLAFAMNSINQWADF